jgi:endonuclease YncB( thermonuclease family)
MWSGRSARCQMRFAAALALLVSPVSASPPIIPRGHGFICTPVAVWDGDGPIWCKEGARVRIAGISAREMDGTCRPGHPCPSASAIDARNALVRLLGGALGVNATGHVLVKGPSLSCVSDGPAGGTRTAAACTFPGGRDLAREMLRTGTVKAWRYR